MKPATSFNLPIDVIRTYRDGDCWALALTINSSKSFPIITASGVNGKWCHAANRLPDGRIIDVVGIWEEAAWLAHWNAQTDSEPFYRNFYGGEGLHAHQWPAGAFHQKVTADRLEPAFETTYDVEDHAAQVLSFI